MMARAKPYFRWVTTAWTLAGALFFGFGAGVGAAETRFVQDRLAIGFWVAPQTDQDVEGRFAEIAAAHFTFVIGLCGGAHPVPVDRQLAWCEKYGLKALIPVSGVAPEQLPDGPSVWGYSIVDEPNASQFPELRKTVDALRRARPGKLGYINLFPNYASREQLGTSNYHFAYSAWPTVTFDAEASHVLEVNPKTGQVAMVVDDSPDMPGLQIALDAGEGRLFLLPAK